MGQSRSILLVQGDTGVPDQYVFFNDHGNSVDGNWDPARGSFASIDVSPAIRTSSMTLSLQSRIRLNLLGATLFFLENTNGYAKSSVWETSLSAVWTEANLNEYPIHFVLAPQDVSFSMDTRTRTVLIFGNPG